jgi:hypothetical protein
MTELAPIILFVYNRPWHTRQTLDSLKHNSLADQSVLYIYADGPREVETLEQLNEIKEVRKLIREQKWCKIVHIIESKINYGIATSMINGITDIVNQYGKIIVLEDDLVLSPGFLSYMNEALDLYVSEERVMHISGYMVPTRHKLQETFFVHTSTCWGWGTWARSWKHFNSNSIELLKNILQSGDVPKFNLNNPFYLDLLKQNAELEKIVHGTELNRNSLKWNWDICWYASVFLRKGLCLHPRKSLVRNIGHDGTGVHCKKDWRSKRYSKQSISKGLKVKAIELTESKTGIAQIEAFHFSTRNPSLYLRISEKIKLTIKNLSPPGGSRL